MDRRVLIVESQNEFALSMASVLKSAGYQTAMAANAADAQRELEKRRPDLVVLRAELPGPVRLRPLRPDQEGQVRPEPPGAPALLGLGPGGPVPALAQTPNAADGYLAIPFEMGELASHHRWHPAASPPPKRDDVDDSLDRALPAQPVRSGSRRAAARCARPPPVGPPKLPKRERRSAITEEDRGLPGPRLPVHRRPQGGAARRVPPDQAPPASAPRADGHARGQDPDPPRRAEDARGPGRPHLRNLERPRARAALRRGPRSTRRTWSCRASRCRWTTCSAASTTRSRPCVQKEREHGATVDDLLLQKFATEKDLIEVVASKEKDINVLRQARSPPATRSWPAAQRSWRPPATSTTSWRSSSPSPRWSSRSRSRSWRRASRAATRRSPPSRRRLQAGAGALPHHSASATSATPRYDGTSSRRSERAGPQPAPSARATVRAWRAPRRGARRRTARPDAEIERLNTERAALEARLSGQMADLEAELAAHRRSAIRALERDKVAQAHEGPARGPGREDRQARVAS